MKIYESVVSDTLLDHFSQQQGRTLMNHAANACGIEEVLATAAFSGHYVCKHSFQTLFPNRTFVVEVSEGIEGERGLAITFYQRENR
jgi:hypothetical protein